VNNHIFFSILVILISLLILCIGSDKFIVHADRLVPHYSNANKIFFLYPEFWVLNKTVMDKNSIIEINVPYHFTKDDAIPYVQIIVENMTSSNESLHKVVNDNILEYNSSEPYIKNVTVDTNSKLGNYSAIEFEYEFKDNGTSMKAMELTSIIDNKTFYFDYVAGQRDYETIIPQIQKIIRSFEVNQ
jgi:hypothetical protein